LNPFLIIRFSSLGDVVIATSVIESIRRRNPDSSVYFLTKSQYFDIIHGLLPDDRILTIDRKPESLLRQIRRIREIRPTVVIDLHRNPRSIVVSHLVQGKVFRTRKRTFERRIAVCSYRKRLEQKHVVDDHFAYLGGLGLELAEPHVVATEREIEFAKLHSIDSDTVVLHPGAKWALKKWSDENYLKLAKLLVQNGMQSLILTEKPVEYFENSGIRTMSGLSLGELKGVLAQAGVFVGNDSGPAHLAAAMSTHSIAIFGPTHPALGFAPYGKFGHVVHRNYSCSPCTLHGEGKCKINNTLQAKCLNDIEPEWVMEKILEILGTIPPNPP